LSRTRERILEERRQVKLQYGELFTAVEALLFRADPIGINFDDNTDEYAAETRTVLPRLKKGKTPADVMIVVHEEFVRWFGVETAGPMSKCWSIVFEIWEQRRSSWPPYGSPAVGSF
jgi:hypothetical protein